MENKDRLGIGVLIGAVLPVIAYLLTVYTDVAKTLLPSKPSGLYILALAINFILVWFAYRRDRQELGKGIVLVTFLGMLLAVFTKTVVI